MVKVFNRAAARGPLAVVEALQAELQLLREENARLRLLQYRNPSAGSIEQLGTVVAEAERLLAFQRMADNAADAADEAWQTLATAMVLRDALVGVCDELIGAAGRLRDRLDQISPWPAEPVAAQPDGSVVDLVAAEAADDAVGVRTPAPGPGADGA